MKTSSKITKIDQEIDDNLGYTEIPDFIISNEMNFKPSEFKVIMTILRYTSGYRRQEAFIPYKVFEDRCGMSKRSILSGWKGLESRGLIKITYGDTGIDNTYKLCFKYSASE